MGQRIGVVNDTSVSKRINLFTDNINLFTTAKDSRIANIDVKSYLDPVLTYSNRKNLPIVPSGTLYEETPFFLQIKITRLMI